MPKYLSMAQKYCQDLPSAQHHFRESFTSVALNVLFSEHTISCLHIASRLFYLPECPSPPFLACRLLLILQNPDQMSLPRNFIASSHLILTESYGGFLGGAGGKCKRLLMQET